MSTCQTNPAEGPPPLLPQAAVKMVIADPQRLLAANAAWLPTPPAHVPGLQQERPEVCPSSCRQLGRVAGAGQMIMDASLPSVFLPEHGAAQKRKFEEAFTAPAIATSAPQPPASPAKRSVSVAALARTSSSVSFNTDSSRPAKSGTVSSAGPNSHGGIRDSASSQPLRGTPAVPVRKICQECGTCNTPQWRTFRASSASLPSGTLTSTNRLLQLACYCRARLSSSAGSSHTAARCVRIVQTCMRRDKSFVRIAAEGRKVCNACGVRLTKQAEAANGKVRNGPKSGARAHAATAAARAQGVPVCTVSVSGKSRFAAGAKRSLDMERFAIETPPNSPQRSPRKAAVRRAALQSQAAMAARGLPAPVYSSHVAAPRLENVHGVYGSHCPRDGLIGTGPPTPPLSPASAASRQTSAEDKLNNQMGISNHFFGPLPGLDHPLQAPGLLSVEHVAELPLLPAPVRFCLLSACLLCSGTSDPETT